MDDLMTTKELAKHMRVSEETLRVWRCRRKGPPFIRVEGTVRYREGDVRDFLFGQTVHSEEKEGE